MGEAISLDHRGNFWTRIPLAFRILAGVAAGIAVGIALGKTHPSILKVLSEFSKVFIELLKALATPLIFFAIVDALLRTNIPARKGFKLLGLSTLNAIVAIVIGLTLANNIHGGDSWKGKLDIVTKEVQSATAAPLSKVDTTKKEVDLGETLKKYFPSNVVTPFQNNDIITVVLMGLLAGAALRRLKFSNVASVVEGVKVVEAGTHAIFHSFGVMLGWIIEILPFAIFGVVAKVVGDTGVDVFHNLGIFLFVILLGLFIHSVVYYSFLLIVVGRTSPLKFFKGAWEAIVTAMSCGSSLVTLPVTLRCLEEKLKISDANARLAACVGTNLNHAGIILYEMAATIFVAQAIGQDLSFGQQLVVAAASIAAGVGIAGVPEAGLITLQLVLTAGGIKPEVVVSVLPLLFTVDWIIGRGRATVNVISDMTVATLLERLDPPEETVAPIATLTTTA